MAEYGTHRIVTAGFAGLADPLWSRTQQDPREYFAQDPAPAPVAATAFVEPLVAKSPGLTAITWWCVGYDGAGEGATPVDSTGIEIDAALCIVGSSDGTAREITRVSSIGETLLSPIEAGRRSVEYDLPPGCSGYLSIISLALGGSTATHVKIRYQISRRNG